MVLNKLSCYFLWFVFLIGMASSKIITLANQHNPSVVIMSDSDSPTSGCFSIFNFKRRSTKSRRVSSSASRGKVKDSSSDKLPQFVLSSRPALTQSTESLTSVTSVEESFANVNGVLDTFAKMAISTHGRKRHSNSTVRAEKLVMYPCFGHFAGQRLYFDLKRSVEHNMMSIKVRTDDQVIAVLHHRQGRRKETVRDQCIKYAHEATTPLVSYRSPSLSFLCEQVINLNLNEIPYRTLPPRYRNTFIGCDRTVTIHVHPRQMHKQVITMRLKPNISIRELQWMIAKRLSLSNPSSLTLYVKDSLEPLSATVPLHNTHNDIVCIIAPTAQQLRPSVGRGPLSVCVSIIGKGVDEVEVFHHTTLFEFEQAVKQKFGLKQESFLYLPDVLSTHNGSSNSYCPLRMHAVLDSSTSTALLLHHEKRSFPILYGHLSVSEQQTLQSLLLYKMTVSELDLLKSGPVIGFEVSGPTIPIKLKTMNDLNSNPTEFSVISVCPHAVSVNPDWTISVLIKFLTSISGFPCSKITISDKILSPIQTVYSQLLNQSWFIVKDDGYILCKDLPTALSS